MARPLLVCSAILTAWMSSAVADDKPATKDDSKSRVAEYLASATTGVRYSEDKDIADGRILRVYVVGTATINTVLGVEEGIEIAKEKAEESAKAEFVKWLGSKVDLRKKSSGEVILSKEGEEGAVRESGKMVERRSKDYEETASALVRGLKLVGAEQKGKEKKYVVMYRWEAKTADAIGRIGEKPTPKVEDKPVAKEPPAVKPPAKKDAPAIPDKKFIDD